MKKKKILIAEDEFTARTLLGFQLSRLGVVFDAVTSGQEAWEFFLKEEYSLVLLDEYMPGLNGSDVLLKIRAQNPSLPVLAMTGDPEAVPRLLKAGFQEVFVKPLHGKEHLDIIQRYLA
ncbi:MAG: response regulator [Spirochaetales bacterium]